jgi:O-antigen biosynthesis protein
MSEKSIAKKHRTSIVIVTCNNLEYNKLCLQSIKEYTKDIDHEIIFVDNRSEDGTAEWLEGLEEVKVIYNKKKTRGSHAHAIRA